MTRFLWCAAWTMAIIWAIMLIGIVAWALIVAWGLTNPLHAESCKPPNVARVLDGLDPTSTTFTTQNTTVLAWPRFQLVCPPEGACRYEAVKPPPSPPVVNVICLTPAEHEAALERGR